MSSRMLGDFPVKDKIVLITGAGSGINFEFAKIAHAAGARLIIGDLKLTPEAETFVASASETIISQKTDVTNWTQLKSLIQTSLSRFGDVPDVYIAGAGVFEPPWSNFWDDEEDDRYAEVDINIGHVIKLTRMAMRALVSHGKKGVVLSIASRAGLQGVYNRPLYCATKHALVGFTKSMRLAEPLEGVKIVTICPGIVDTPLWDPVKRDQMGKDIMSRSLLPVEVAEEMLKLVQEGKFVGGTVYSTESSRSFYVVPEWNIEPTPFVEVMDKVMHDMSGQVPAMFQETRDKLDKERGVAWP